MTIDNSTDNEIEEAVSGENDQQILVKTVKTRARVLWYFIFTKKSFEISRFWRYVQYKCFFFKVARK